MFRALIILVVAGPLFFSLPPAAAQVTGGFDEPITTGTSYRVFALPGEPTVTVQLLGDIASGVYVVGSETNLLTLLSLAGGAALGEGVGQRRTLTVRVLRTEGARRTIIYEADFHQLLREPGAYPPLRDGDVVTVDAVVRQRFTLMNALQVVTSLGTIVLLVLRLVDGQ